VFHGEHTGLSTSACKKNVIQIGVVHVKFFFRTGCESFLSFPIMFLLTVLSKVNLVGGETCVYGAALLSGIAAGGRCGFRYVGVARACYELPPILCSRA
jgi:hypothetical protein